MSFSSEKLLGTILKKNNVAIRLKKHTCVAFHTCVARSAYLCSTERATCVEPMGAKITGHASVRSRNPVIVSDGHFDNSIR